MVLYDPNPIGRKSTPFDAGYCAFELLDSGTWYKVDLERLEPKHYTNVPDDILMRAESVINKALDSGGPICDFRVDPAPYYEAALRKEFDDARFLGADFVPGVVY